ncbi:hypothetical protein UlMin_001449 [Ulmus minor]
MYNNFSKKHKGEALRTEVGTAAKATTFVSFTIVMDRIKALDVDSYEWLANKRPQEWSKSHFEDHCKCDVLLNNWCKSFNEIEMLLEAREKPILSCLEHIRNKWFGKLDSRVHKILKRNKLQSGWCHVISNGYSKFQITNGMRDQFAMDLANKTCSCQAWDLNGILCAHVVVAIYHQRHDPLDYVNPFYKKETILKTYKSGPKLFLRPIAPRNNKRQPDRPKMLRRRELDESAPPNATKLRKYNVVIFCTKCKQQGHNSRTCDKRKQKVEKNKTKQKR